MASGAGTEPAEVGSWRGKGLPGEHVVLPHLNHFTILDEMCLPQSRLRDAIARLAE